MLQRGPSRPSYALLLLLLLLRVLPMHHRDAASFLHELTKRHRSTLGHPLLRLPLMGTSSRFRGRGDSRGSRFLATTHEIILGLDAGSLINWRQRGTRYS